MIDYPKITVVTPCFNMENFLEQTILSVLNQNYPNLEYIIIDGGSSDGSVEIIKKYADKISFWLSEKDQGMYHAIQKGFDRSTGEIMCWLNADDLFLPNSLFSVAKLFSKYPQCEWIEGNNVICNEEGSLVNSNLSTHHTRYYFLSEKHLSKDGVSLNRFGTLQQESTFWRRKLWEKTGSKIETSLKFAGDFELWMRFYRSADLFTTSLLLSAFRIRNEQTSARYRAEYLLEVKKVVESEKKLCSIEDRKILRFISKVNRFPALLRFDRIKKKYFHYTQNIVISI